MKYENEIGSKGEQSSLTQASLHRSFHETVRKNGREGCASVVESGERSSPTSAEFLFYLALYASVGQEPKHIMARWHFCNYSQVLGLGSPNT